MIDFEAYYQAISVSLVIRLSCMRTIIILFKINEIYYDVVKSVVTLVVREVKHQGTKFLVSSISVKHIYIYIYILYIC